MDSQVLTLAEAAERLRIPRRSAAHLARCGRFPGDAARKVGRRWIVSAPRLEQFLHADKEAS